jgi:calcineurin-like phosphoesterase family protein
MSTVRFISDLHLGHEKILQFSPSRGGDCVVSHSEWLVDQWNSVVGKNDTTWVLGDVCFNKNHLKYLKMMKGQKIMVWGNHDKFPLTKYQEYFHLVYGFRKKYGFWISHAPIHEQELRGRRNIHGHVHSQSIPDPRYINVCVEALNGIPITLEEIK